MEAEEKRMVLSLTRIFFDAFCIAKNSSLLSIPKPNVLVIKENCEGKTCRCHSYLRMAFSLIGAI